jgi:hypothetical protein
MVLYIIAGALHMGTFTKNKKVGKKFIFGGMMFGKIINPTLSTLDSIAYLTSRSL